MDKIYNHKLVEEKIYQMWEERKYFTPQVDLKKKPYSIILPPPNANAPLHFGHAMYVVEDILIRCHRMMGYSTLWLPGADHAGFETQFVFEKKLEKEGKSRLDFNRDELYKMIFDYVLKNRKGMEKQLKRLGFSLDWTRNKFTLDQDIIKIVYQTFEKMYHDGLIYRGERLVNYCTKCGTSFSDLEVNHKEQKDPLYFIKYGPLVLATVRPETKFGDTAIAVNPKDKRYQKYIGRTIEFETLLGRKKMKVIADEAVDPNFGTGVVKVTPAHDMKDFEMGKRHKLRIIKTIDLEGKLTEAAGPYKGMRVKEARKKIAEDMEKKGLIEKIDKEYVHTIEVCYKCGTTIEPMLMPQWFIKMKPLADLAIEAIERKKIKFYPKRHEKTILWFLKNIQDWNISRQTVWGIRIPAYRCQNLKSKPQNLDGNWFISIEQPQKCEICGKCKFEQDPDTFDTWFSSSQWPFATLKTTRPEDFDYFYPTSVMETMYDILLFWVARMIMVGLYATGQVPFKDVVLHGMVKDPLGKKMSKSKGNVVDPLEIVEQYGADAVRFALVYGTAFGNDQSLSYSKLDAARKFTNKLWNIGRFIEINRSQNLKVRAQKSMKELLELAKNKTDKEWIDKIDKLIIDVTKHIKYYNFHFASERLYNFIWHEFADKYIENIKSRIDENSYLVLISLFLTLLKLLHPFMPFVTEEIYQRFNFGESLTVERWPKSA